MWLSKNGISVKVTVFTSNFLTKPLLTTVHFFLYVQIRFRTFRIAVTPSWNNCNNTTNVPTKVIPESNETDFWLTSLHLFASLTNSIISTWMQVSFLFGASARKCRENFLFNRKRFEIWLVKTRKHEGRW